MKRRCDRRSSAGFTLVELLVAITVIAILAAMAIPAVMAALTRAHETAVVFEVSQLDMAMEQFKSEYGFYPPSFESDVTSLEELMPYVTLMSPNHGERFDSGVPGGAYLASGNRMRLEHWWIEVGQYLDQESSLVFWLSGVCKNKRHPITGSATTGGWRAGQPPLAAHSLFYEIDGLERDVIYEFKSSQLVGDVEIDKLGVIDVNEMVFDKNGDQLPRNQVGFILEYRQPYGGNDGDEYTSPDGLVTALTDYRYRYRSAESYPGIFNGGGADVAYHGGSGAYANPNRFQIVSFGMDGLPGVPGNWDAVNGGTVAVDGTDFFGPWGADNITNFANGRLEKWVVEVE